MEELPQDHQRIHSVKLRCKIDPDPIFIDLFQQTVAVIQSHAVYLVINGCSSYVTLKVKTKHTDGKTI